MEFAHEKLFLIYEHSPYLDVLHVNGQLSRRYDLRDPFLAHPSLQLLTLRFVQAPLLKWSNRQSPLRTALSKLILAGTVLFKKEVRNFLMVFSLESGDADLIKVVDDSGSQVTCLNYGPYDNGHILVGTSDGRLLAFDYLTLARLDTVEVFPQKAVTCITFDPTNYVFVGSEEGKVVALTYKDRLTHYMYLDLGKNKYCTVELKKNVRSVAENEQNGGLCCV